MRLVILGAGAIGGAIAAHLARAGRDVLLQSWLLALGWQRRGLVRVDEVPGPQTVSGVGRVWHQS